MARIVLDNVSKSFTGPKGEEVRAVNNVSLAVEDKEFVVLVGPSGCGKSTTLRMIAGLEEISRGSISIDDKIVNEVEPKDRDVAMVFQNYALYPHMTVYENMAFGLKLRKYPKAEIEKRVRQAAEILGITTLLDRLPKALSGGQRQRVAMGRAIVRQPQVFLMDEPLSNLDAKLRVQTRSQIATLQAKLGITTVYVTHDQVEAMTMGHRVAVLKDGVLQQVDTPRNLYDRPVNEFVAGFIGSPAMNLVPVALAEGGAVLAGHQVPLPRSAMVTLAEEGSRTATLGFRPEAVEFVGEGAGFPVEVQVVEELGSDAFAYGRLRTDDADAEGRLLVLRADARRPPMKGEIVHVAIRSGETHVFSAQTGARVSDVRV